MVAGRGAFLTDSCRSSDFGIGSAIIPLARDLLGTDYNFGDHTVVVGHGSRRFRGAFHGDGAWSGSWRNCG